MKSLMDKLEEIRQKQDSQEEINASILLTQTEMSIKQEEQDEVLAEILLNQAGGNENV